MSAIDTDALNQYLDDRHKHAVELGTGFIGVPHDYAPLLNMAEWVLDRHTPECRECGKPWPCRDVEAVETAIGAAARRAAERRAAQ